MRKAKIEKRKVKRHMGGGGRIREQNGHFDSTQDASFNTVYYTHVKVYTGVQSVRTGVVSINRSFFVSHQEKIHRRWEKRAE